jgi:NAD-dependent DNA ligase (contains BRCT domain type II)
MAKPMSKSKCMSHKKDELVKMCSKKKLGTSGTKEDLCKRLLAVEKKSPPKVKKSPAKVEKKSPPKVKKSPAKVEKKSPPKVKKSPAKKKSSAKGESCHMDLKTADSLSQKKFLAQLEKYDESYFSSDNEEEIIPDELYDSLEQLYEKKFGPRRTMKVAPSSDNVLPYYMGSLRKIKEEKALETWKEKYPGPWSITDKIDGISSLYMFGDGEAQLFTKHRGGLTGNDISHFIPHLFSEEQLEAHKNGEKMSIRGELVIPKQVFQEKYSVEYSNARNLVSGIANRKASLLDDQESKKMDDIWFITYQIFDSDMSNSEQIKTLKSMGFRTPELVIKKEIDVDILSEWVKQRKDESEYEMDGVVLVSQSQHYDDPIKDLPKHAIAFKIQSETGETTVKKVEWNASKNGLLKPRVSIEPVNLCGAEVKWATGFNARFIHDNSVGEGAKILIARSGDVIPHIIKVLSPASSPDFPMDKKWKWNKNHVEIELIGDDDEGVQKKKAIYFFKQMGVKFLGPKIIDKLFDDDYNTLHKIFSLTQHQLMNLPGIKEKSADRILESIHTSITDVSLPKLMSASGVFGTGFAEKKMETIVSHFPNILTDFNDSERKEWEEKVKGIGGFVKMAEPLVSKLGDFQQFLKDHPMIKLKEGDEEKEKDDTEDDGTEEKSMLNKMSIVFTGFRDKELEAKIKKQGGKIGSSVSSKTFVVVVKDLDGETSKVLKAKELGIPVMTLEQFTDKYEL